MQNTSSRNFGEVLRDEMIMSDRILQILHASPKTIPEIASALGQPLHEVTCWVMAMWRYGKVIETSKALPEGYFQYTIKK